MNKNNIFFKNVCYDFLLYSIQCIVLDIMYFIVIEKKFLKVYLKKTLYKKEFYIKKLDCVKERNRVIDLFCFYRQESSRLKD